MSKERAARRAAREAQETAARAARARAVARRARRREIRQRLTPSLPARRRVGKMFPRRSIGERVIIGLVYAVVLLGVWTMVDGLTTRIALTAVATLAMPAVVVIAFGRRS